MLSLAGAGVTSSGMNKTVWPRSGFSRLWFGFGWLCLELRSVDSMATNPLSAAVAGTEDRIGGLGTPTQAAQGGRPDGDVGTGDRATKAWDGLKSGADLLHLALLHHHLSQPSLRQQQLLLPEALQCLTKLST